MRWNFDTGFLYNLFALLKPFLFSENILSNPGLLVDTNSGEIRGISSLSRDGRQFYEWLGIPYAKPPVGNLRFASPEPVGKWEGIRDGSRYGGICAQMDTIALFGVVSGTEDCLFLNVYTPEVKRGTKTKIGALLLPVIFFIHGGYFAAGSSTFYRPEYFMDEDIVLVTINYRLGALGFLSTGDSVVRGNMGLKDQSLALKWVHDNIQNFGGDPKQITIYGESAGAVSTHMHLLSPRSRGLMKKAITQSGNALCIWGLNENPVSQAKRFAKQLKCPTESSTKMVECLRKVDARILLEVHRENLDPAATKDKLFIPVIESVIDDDTFLAEHPLKLMKNGQQGKIPWLTGANMGDGLIWTHNAYKNATYRKLIENDWNILADSQLFLSPSEKQLYGHRIQEFYFGNETKLNSLEKLTNLTNLVTDRKFMSPLHKSIRIQAPFSPVYLVYYNKMGPSFLSLLMSIQGKFPPIVDALRAIAITRYKYLVLPHTNNSSFGVCHADDLTMLFKITGSFSIPPSDPNYQFSKDFVRLYTSFASNDDESKYQFRKAHAPRVPTNETVMELKCLEINDVPAVRTMPGLNRMAFWKSLEQEKTR